MVINLMVLLQLQGDPKKAANRKGPKGQKFFHNFLKCPKQTRMTKTVRIAQGGPQLWPPSSSQNILLVPFWDTLYFSCFIFSGCGSSRQQILVDVDCFSLFHFFCFVFWLWQQIADIGCRPPVPSCHLSCPSLNQPSPFLSVHLAATFACNFICRRV